MEYTYNPYNKIFTLNPKSDMKVKFNNIGFIKFGNSFTEPNLCDKNSGFTYKLDEIDYAKSDNQFIVMYASSMQSKSGHKVLP